MYGKPVLQPRLICYMADDISKGYSYSGAAMIVEPWHDCVLPIKVPLQTSAGNVENSLMDTSSR
jgi:hypothetical protein